jgi:hypothetical protein
MTGVVNLRQMGLAESMGELLPGLQPPSFNRGEVGKLNRPQGEAGFALALPTNGHNCKVVSEIEAFQGNLLSS